MHACLRFCNSPVIDRRSYLLDEEVEQQARWQFSDGFRHIFFEIALDGSNSICPDLLCEVDGCHRGELSLRAYIAFLERMWTRGHIRNLPKAASCSGMRTIASRCWNSSFCWG